jgi:hypothetical protein
MRDGFHAAIINAEDSNSIHKIEVVDYMSHIRIDHSEYDFVKLEHLLIEMNNLIDRCEKEDKYKDTYFYFNMDHEENVLYLEIFRSRIETDEEFKERIEELRTNEQVKENGEIERLKELAEKYDYKLVKLGENDE